MLWKIVIYVVIFQYFYTTGIYTQYVYVCEYFILWHGQLVLELNTSVTWMVHFLVLQAHPIDKNWLLHPDLFWSILQNSAVCSTDFLTTSHFWLTTTHMVPCTRSFCMERHWWFLGKNGWLSRNRYRKQHHFARLIGRDLGATANFCPLGARAMPKSAPAESWLDSTPIFSYVAFGIF